ncbi:hypothetical protein Misp01_43440 [Microtetraspora sp. NBRC 13810]|uniref:anti-sigma factor family protein n=1 Tax=Microtetraspora sp. NBRC 13810 TaxID=3030990 RepID=UPI0024A21732|nr:zf-HC2 domain-containing protein [Microtetraspora sp. NBRC 13810]GLW09215.1 hypothetical protein Misp01_43440 [Microtetraspora sp. NBRC 13810]
MKRFSCEELVELVTDYLDDGLDDAARHRFGDHLTDCAACTRYLAQYRTTVKALGDAPGENLSPATRERLLTAFRTARRT